MSNKETKIWNYLISAITAVCVFYICAVTDFSVIINNLFAKINIPAMAVSIVVCILMNIILSKINIHIPYALKFIGSGLSLLFLLTSYILERNNFEAADHKSFEMTLHWYVLALIVILLFVIYTFICNNKKITLHISAIRKKLPKQFGSIAILFTILFFIGISAYHFYTIDFTYYYDFFNTHAYLNSILNIFWGQPFTKTITSIYGHYAFFYYPIMKLAYTCGAHNLYKVYTIITTALNILTLLIWIRVLCWNVKNRLIQFSGIIMICYVSASRILSIYPANNPNRVLPPAVMALLLSLWYKAKGKSKLYVSIIGYLTCIALIIWNTETGIFAVVSWSALHICRILQTKQKMNWFLILLHLLFIPLSFFAAVFLCGCLNVMFGGEMISVYDFVFPMTSTKHMNLIEIPLQKYPSAWMSILALTFLFLGYGLKDTILCADDNTNYSNQSAVCFSFTVLALGTLSYPINRPAYSCFFVILPFAAILTAIIAEQFVGYKKNLSGDFFRKHSDYTIKGFLGLISSFVMLVMIISCFVNIPYKLKHSKSYKNTETITQIYKWILDQKDKKALAIGNSTSMFYAYLGWDPGIYYMDSSNYFINEDSFRELIEKSKSLEDKSLFVSRDFRWYLSNEFLESHQMTSKIKIDDLNIEYWTPITESK